MILAEKNSPMEVINHILQVNLTVVLLWQWWNERNRVREGEKRRGAEDLAYVIEKHAVEFLGIEKEAVVVPNKPVQRWRKPMNEKMKITSDGAFTADTGEGGWGYVIEMGMAWFSMLARAT